MATYRRGALATALGRGRPQPAKQLSEKLVDYAVQNPLKLLSTFVLVSGGLLLLTYFVHIGFLPDVELNAAASMLYAVALVGLLIAGYTAVVIVLPGWFIALSRDAQQDIRDADVLWAVGLGTTFWCLLLWVFWIVPVAPWEMNTGVLIVLILTGGASLLNAKWDGWGLATWPRWPKWLIRRRLWVVGATFGYVFGVALSLVFTVQFAIRGDLPIRDTPSQVAMLGAVLVIFAVCAVVLAVIPPQNRLKAALVFAPSALFLALAVTGSFSAIAQIAVQRFSLGEMPYTRVVVDGKTCQQVNQALGACAVETQI
jgi:hypothetical protein